MYNRFYNRQPYNRGNVNNDIKIKGKWYSKLDGFLVIGADYYTTARLSVELKGSALPTKGININDGFESKLDGILNGTQGINLAETWGGVLTGTVYLGANISLKSEFMESKLQGDMYLGADVLTKGNLESDLAGKMFLGANIYEQDDLYSILLGYLSISDILENTLIVNGTIPPNGTLVIDSSNYTMLLNDKDVIHLHKGDWIFAERGTVEFIMTAIGTDEFNWEVYYVDKYL